MDDYKKRIIEFVRACGSVASCIDAVCRAYPMEGAVKACGTLCADVLCAACRVPSLSYGGRRQSMWHVACLRAVCGMPCAEPILWRAQSKRVALSLHHQVAGRVEEDPHARPNTALDSSPEVIPVLASVSPPHPTSPLPCLKLSAGLSPGEAPSLDLALRLVDSLVAFSSDHTARGNACSTGIKCSCLKTSVTQPC
ncbi:hypothetical protein RRG08_066211 [Elysia crispata]|uniref:Uncharacterized protein n=1 Tax=Elysia crispata TaxID=231223 RepID=A0AAE1BD99_9GAST|nr:hypothetical protein RRG08_066211 [Elysia crispata]